MMEFLQRSYLELAAYSRRKDKTGGLAFGRCMARRSIVFLCCVTAEFLCYSIDVCDTVTPETSALGRTLGVKSKYDIRHGFAPAFQGENFVRTEQSSSIHDDDLLSTTVSLKRGTDVATFRSYRVALRLSPAQ